MFKLLEIEYKKVKGYPVFWIIFSVIILLFVNLSAFLPYSDLSIGIFNPVEGLNLFGFPKVWSTLTWIAGWFSFLWVFLMIILIGNEFNYRMFRQQLILGTYRKELFLSKFLLAVVVPVLMITIIFILGSILGFTHKSGLIKHGWFDNIYFLLYYLVQTLAYLGFASLIVYLVKSTGLSIILYLSYYVFELIVRLIVNIADMHELVFYLPMKSLSLLTPSPIKLTTAAIPFDGAGVLIMPLIYMILFWSLSYLLFRKRNL